MTLDELQAQAENDLKIDDTELDLESLKTPQLHSQYLKTYSTYALTLKKAEGDHSQLHLKKWLFYTGKAEPQDSEPILSVDLWGGEDGGQIDEVAGRE